MSVLIRLLVPLALVPAIARPAEWIPTWTSAATWNANASNANVATDRMAALQLVSDVNLVEPYSIGGDDSLLPSLHVGGEWWPRYHALSLLTPGIGIGWRHKFGLGPLAPIFSATLTIDAQIAQETERSGTEGGAVLALRKRLTDATQLEVTAEFSRIDARRSVYDRTASQTSVRLAHDIDDRVRVTLTPFWRSGDIVSYATPPRPELVALAADRIAVTTFGRSMVAYAISAQTWGVSVGAERRLNATSTVGVGYEYRETRRDALRYRNHLVSLSVGHQF